MSRRIWSAPWKSGPDLDRSRSGPVLVSVTEFAVHRPWEALGVVAAGFRLRQSWPRTPGAVAVRLWMDPDPCRPRTGAVSVWTGGPGLAAFVARPDHLRIVRSFRGRGRIRSYSRELAHWDADAAWESALPTLSGAAPWPGLPRQENCTYGRAIILLVNTPLEEDMAPTIPPTSLPAQVDGPNQEFKDELDRLIDEQLFPQELLPQQPGDPRTGSGAEGR